VSRSTLTVPEMSCEACRVAVAGAVRPLPGVTGVEVDLDSKLVTLEHEQGRPTLEALAAAIEQQGYEVVGSEVS
jgi:copper chaperone